MVKAAKGKGMLDKVSDRTTKLASLVSAFVVLTGAVAGVCSWVSTQFANAISSQISEFREETKQTNEKHEQALTRIELSMLIEHDPTNTVAIEKMARYYFQELDGDLYMTQRYSEWAKVYGGDTSIVVGVK